MNDQARTDAEAALATCRKEADASFADLWVALTSRGSPEIEAAARSIIEIDERIIDAKAAHEIQIQALHDTRNAANERVQKADQDVRVRRDAYELSIARVLDAREALEKLNLAWPTGEEVAAVASSISPGSEEAVDPYDQGKADAAAAGENVTTVAGGVAGQDCDEELFEEPSGYTDEELDALADETRAIAIADEADAEEPEAGKATEPANPWNW